MRTHGNGGRKRITGKLQGPNRRLLGSAELSRGKVISSVQTTVQTGRCCALGKVEFPVESSPDAANGLLASAQP